MRAADQWWRTRGTPGRDLSRASASSSSRQSSILFYSPVAQEKMKMLVELYFELDTRVIEIDARMRISSAGAKKNCNSFVSQSFAIRQNISVWSPLFSHIP
jgi:hypothetical protein